MIDNWEFSGNLGLCFLCPNKGLLLSMIFSERTAEQHSSPRLLNSKDSSPKIGWGCSGKGRLFTLKTAPHGS